jgi:hypothetical protein
MLPPLPPPLLAARGPVESLWLGVGVGAGVGLLQTEARVRAMMRDAEDIYYDIDKI